MARLPLSLSPWPSAPGVFHGPGLRSAPLLALLIVWWGGVLPNEAAGAEKDAARMNDRRAVEAAEEAFLEHGVTGNRSRFPWYDTESGELRPMPMPPSEPLPAPYTPTTRSVNLPSLGWLVFFLLAVGILVLLIYFLYSFLQYYLREKEDAAEEAEIHRRRIEALPQEAREKEDDLLTAAKEAREQGDLRAALIFYFSYVLTQLDQHHLVLLHKGKTNYEYLAELRTVPEIQPYYRRVMLLFEETYFGQRPVPPERFEEIWRLREHFQKMLSDRRETRQAKSSQVGLSSATVRGGLLFAVLGAMLVNCPGCGSREEEWGASHYLYTPSRTLDVSVNGTIVFREMCRAGDHTCRRASKLSPTLEYFDVIVWFCSNGKPPTEESRRWLEKWLEEKPNRTVVFVPRAYHADPYYFEAIASKLTPREISESRFHKEERESRSRLDSVLEAPWQRNVDLVDYNSFEEFETSLQQEAEEEVDETSEPEENEEKNSGPIDAGWYVLEKRPDPLVVEQLRGDATWTRNIDVEETRLTLYQKFTPAEAETLLAAQDDAALVARREFGESQLLLVPSGVFLLNMQLIRESHRKLAGRLIAEFGPAGRRVVLLDASHAPVITDQTNSEFDMPLGMHLLVMWPTCFIFWQFLVLGILLCFWKWPAFGRRHRLPDPPLADFGEHIEAVAKLQHGTRVPEYPKQQWLRYWKLVQPKGRPPDG